MIASRNRISISARTRLRLFVTLWVMAVSFHYDDADSLSLMQLPMLLAGIPAVLWPESGAAFAAFAVIASLVFAIQDWPAAANHIALAFVVHATIAAGAWLWWRRGGDHWIERIRAPLVTTLAVVYAFAAFAKLNTAFFDAHVSCVRDLMAQTLALSAQRVPVPSDHVIVAGALLTVLWEFALAAGLSFARTRPWAVVIGVCGHVFLGFAHFYDFAAFVFALYLLALPDWAFDDAPGAERWRRIALGAWCGYALLTGPAWAHPTARSPIVVHWYTLQVMAWLAAVGAILFPRVVAAFAGRPQTSSRLPSFAPGWLAIAPVLAGLNGLTPYLGVKTETNYTMFSNLRVEAGRTNHLLPFVRDLRISPVTDDVVEVRSVAWPDTARLGPAARALGGPSWIFHQVRWLDTPDVRVPWLELRRAVGVLKGAGLTGVHVRYIHDGVSRDVPDATVDPVLSAPLPWWDAHMAAFRPITGDGMPAACEW